MRRRSARDQQARRAVRASDSAAALGLPLGLVLSSALRRIARERPEVFERLGAHRTAAFLITPTGLPVAFRLEPHPTGGRVTLVSAEDRCPVAARIRGPLLDLLALFTGAHDADAAFFARRVEITGDTHAVVALHNTLEAADLGLADLLGAPRAARPGLNAGLAALLDRLRARHAEV